jgi:hypothetical protein
MQMKNDASRSIQILDQESGKVHATNFVPKLQQCILLYLLAASTAVDFQDVPSSIVEKLFFGLL